MPSVFLFVPSDSVKETFDVLEETSVKVDPDEEHPSQLYWIFKHQYTFQEAQLWCLKRNTQSRED